jgi:hypothetical protein
VARAGKLRIHANVVGHNFFPVSVGAGSVFRFLIEDSLDKGDFIQYSRHMVNHDESDIYADKPGADLEFSVAEYSVIPEGSFPTGPERSGPHLCYMEARGDKDRKFEYSYRDKLGLILDAQHFPNGIKDIILTFEDGESEVSVHVKPNITRIKESSSKRTRALIISATLADMGLSEEYYVNSKVKAVLVRAASDISQAMQKSVPNR